MLPSLGRLCLGAPTGVVDKRPRDPALPRSAKRRRTPPSRRDCWPLTKSRIDDMLRKLIEEQRNMPPELLPLMDLSQKTVTLRIVLSSGAKAFWNTSIIRRPPWFAGSMWDMIRPRDVQGGETKEQEQARVDPLVRDFFRLYTAHYLNESILEDQDGQYDGVVSVDLGHGFYDREWVTEPRVRIAFVAQDDASHENLSTVLWFARKELDESYHWKKVFKQNLFGQGDDLTPDILKHKVFNTRGCPDAVLLDITFELDAIRTRMTDPIRRQALLNNAASAAIVPDEPGPPTPEPVPPWEYGDY